MNQFRPDKEFLDIFFDIQYNFTNTEEAYNYAERIFADKCLRAFGKPYRKYSSFESFQFNKNRKK